MRPPCVQCTYPVVYVFPMFGLSGPNSVVAIQLGYCCSDIISKCGVGFLIYNVRRRAALSPSAARHRSTSAGGGVHVLLRSNDDSSSRALRPDHDRQVLRPRRQVESSHLTMLPRLGRSPSPSPTPSPRGATAPSTTRPRRRRRRRSASSKNYLRRLERRLLRGRGSAVRGMKTCVG